jgi:hypothetical protein
MKRLAILFPLAGVVALLTGCASEPRGGTADTTYYDAARPANAEPIYGSPTMRPGMNSRDIRDPNALTRPLEPTAGQP